MLEKELSIVHELRQIEIGSVKKMIDEALKVYKIKPSRVIADYLSEKQYTTDYNGRQILELLQNADDAKTDRILIKLDASEQELTIANNGVPFDIDGLESLMLANFSSKNPKEFIGNKGLGFRSVLNWVNKVKVVTQKVSLEFSPSYAKKHYDIVAEENGFLKDLTAKNEKLEEGEIPFAILAIPKIEENNIESNWQTEIILHYKKEEETAILEQLKTIQDEILLFLKHTQEIEIRGAGEFDKILSKNRPSANEITINDTTWNILDSGRKEFKDNKLYNFKIAWQSSLKDAKPSFFTYFPTDVKTHLPCLIHGTFDLNGSRKELNNTVENKFILNEIAQHLGEIASNHLKAHKSNWQAYQFLSQIGKSDNKLLIEFYQNVEDLRANLEIYPCVDGSYCKLEDIVFYGDEFSNWVIRNGVEEYFSNLLISNSLDINIYGNKEYTFDGWLDIMNLVKDHINNTHEVVLLIKMLTANAFKRIHESKSKLPLLFDKNQDPVSEKIQVFTLTKEHIAQYKIQGYVDIAFMSSILYEELLNVFENEIEDIWNGIEDKSRPLKKIISKVVNIGSNDITDVIRHIVSSADIEMKNTESDDLNDIAIGLVDSLFSIYQVNPARRNSINLNITVLNRNLDLVLASDLYLGNEYELGVATSIIFADIFTDKDYLVSNDFWQLEEGGYEYLENFFAWLGVNRISKISTKSVHLNRNQDDEFTKFVFSQTSWPENDSHKDYSVLEITDFKKISSNPNFSLEVLLAWFISDIKISNQLSFENTDTFSYKYNTKVTPVNYKPSFIYFQIKELYLNKQNNKIIEDLDFAKELGYSSIDFEHQIFRNLEIDKDQITPILNLLNISVSFDDLEPKDVYNIIEGLPQVDLDGKYARKLYDLSFKYFKTKEAFDFSKYPKDYKLLAKRKGRKEFIELNEVYYSDNSTLPSKISEEFWMFDFPKRLGESQISKYFGVKTFKEVAIVVNLDSVKESHISPEFQAWLLKIRPYILAYRISSIKKSIEKTIAEELKKVEISIISSLIYNLPGGGEKQLLPGEILPKSNGKGYYLCVESNATLENIKDTPNVCEAFAEILCILFKVNEHKDDYRSIFKDKNSLKDTKYIIDVKSLNEHYKMALELLGISNEEINFWTKIYDFKNHPLPKEIKDTKELSALILKDLGFEMSSKYINIDYQNFDNEEGILFLSAINKALGVPIAKIFDQNSDGIVHYHLKRFETLVMDYKKFFNSCLWAVLTKDLSKQKDLISCQEKYEYLNTSKEIQDKLYENRFTLDVNYIQILKDKVYREFSIQLKEKDEHIVILKPEYNKILEENNLTEVDIESDETRSLLYFKGNEDKLKTLLGVEKQVSEDLELDANSKEKLTGKLIYSSSEKVVPKKRTDSGSSHGSWNHGDKDVKRNKMAGKKAEERVYNSLLESVDVADVEWVSSFSNTSDKSDNKHYDIRYKPSISNFWKYLEVKSFNGSYFHLSKFEKEEAIKRGKDFEIALVIGEEIHILKDYFNEDIDFENNDKFYASTADYIITLKIKNKTE